MSISTFTGLETALRGLMAQQQALDVTGQNITNASTPGYTRQTVSFATTPSLQISPGHLLGTGVTVTGYQRVRDSFLDTQLRAQTMLQGSAQATQDGLGQIEGVINEPSDSGLNSLLGSYWSAWQNVANSPQDMATRQSLIEAATSLTNGLNNAASQLATIQAQTGQDVTLSLQQVNADGQTLQGLNTAIKNATAVGNTPNELLDQRDQILDGLSKLGNVTSVNNGDGTITVTFDSVTLADQAGAYTLSEAAGTISNNMAVPQTAAVSQNAGSIGGLIALRDTTIPGYQTSLDAIAAALISQTNAASVNGFGLDGVNNRPFFGGTDASTISVLATPTTIAASASAATLPGDNTNALAIAQIQATGIASLAGATIDGAYAQLVTTVGSDSQAAQRSTSNAGVLVNSLANRRDAISTVSLDEEMTNLVKYQQGYQAAARALSAMDDALNLLINRTGRVGL
jgi:flagellar hook-associated protein 1 FlgK